MAGPPRAFWSSATRTSGRILSWQTVPHLETGSEQAEHAPPALTYQLVELSQPVRREMNQVSSQAISAEGLSGSAAR